MSDELRNRIRRLDPMGPDVETRSVQEARQMMEDVMSTKTPENNTNRRSDSGARIFRPTGAVTSGSSIAIPRPLIPVMAGLVALVIAAFALLGGGSTAPLMLSAGEGSALASCLPFSQEILADMEVAFEGTVTGIDGEVLTLDVVTWYSEGEAEQVMITAPLGMEALIGGISFEVGGNYLVTATDGVVNYCGYTAAATPELRQAFDSAF